MKKVILFMAGILASMMLNAQSRWSVTPEAGLVVNKENEGTSVTLGFKAGAGVLYQLKEGVGKKPSFWLIRSGSLRICFCSSLREERLPPYPTKR